MTIGKTSFGGVNIVFDTVWIAPIPFSCCKLRLGDICCFRKLDLSNSVKGSLALLQSSLHASDPARFPFSQSKQRLRLLRDTCSLKAEGCFYAIYSVDSEWDFSKRSEQSH